MEWQSEKRKRNDSIVKSKKNSNLSKLKKSAVEISHNYWRKIDN